MRRERGAAPGDEAIFGDHAVPALRCAVADLGWLLSRGYPEAASLKLVGDRHALTARQRKAVQRGACSDEARDRRRARRLDASMLRGRDLEVDGLNCIIGVESVLSGAPVFRGIDGALRDLASVHGTWRQLGVTTRAVEALARVLASTGPKHVRFWLDRPVSNSGRLRVLLLRHAELNGMRWDVELHDDPDRVLIERGGIVATADARILDACHGWVDLPAAVAGERAGVWLVDLTCDRFG